MRRKIKPGPAKYFQNSLSIHQLMLGLFSGCGEPYDTRPPPDDGIDTDVSIRCGIFGFSLFSFPQNERKISKLRLTFYIFLSF